MDNRKTADLDTCSLAEEMSLTNRGQYDDTIFDFVDPGKNLNGRIGVYKINFNKNLRRFQELASETAHREPSLTTISNRFLCETLLPSIWT